MKKKVAYLLCALVSVSVSFVSSAQKDTLLASAHTQKPHLRLNGLKTSSSIHPQGKLPARAKDFGMIQSASDGICCLSTGKADAGRNTALCNKNLLKFRNRMSLVVPEHKCLP